MSLFPSKIIGSMKKVWVVAGFSVDDLDHAQPIAEALLDGGLNVIELTMRTDAAFDALNIIIKKVPEIIAGVGTILTPQQVRRVKEMGGAFGVSPGLNPAVVQECTRVELPFAPGIVTPSELEVAVSLGCRFVKFFPAEPAGGIAYLRSLAAPYSHLGIQYFALGGINNTNMINYLQEPNVPTVGGSWIVDKDLVAINDWKAIRARAADVRAAVDSRNQ